LKTQSAYSIKSTKQSLTKAVVDAYPFPSYSDYAIPPIEFEAL